MSDKKLEWQERMDQWRESGLSMAAWCRERNINIHQMYYWKRRFDQLLEAKAASTDWFDVSQSNSLNEGASIMIRVNNLSVEVNPQVDRQLLSDVLHLLKYE